MSYNMHNLNIVVPATDALINAVTPEGYRMAVIRWRETAEVKKSGKKPPAPRCVLVAEIPLSITRPLQLQVKLREALDKMQDDRIRDILNKHLEENGNVLNITLRSDDINEDGIAAWMREESGNGRISGETIRAWFDERMAAYIEDAAISKGMEGVKVTQTINNYRATFMKLASPVTPIAEPVLLKLAEVMAAATEDNTVAMDEKIAAAITRRMPKSEEEMLMEI